MTGLTASIIVVSLERPDSLKLCLLGLLHQTHSPFEVIVVADPSGLDMVQDMGLGSRIKTVPFEERNISKARNAGLEVAAGDVVAFIDDDAVPEPTWLAFLMLPFAESDIGAAGGFVRGRNGISFQWKARQVDECGRHTPFDVPETEYSKWPPRDGKAIRTEGTNMAFRRALLLEVGGFDPAYRFFLDETDLNMRLGRRGVVTAICPQAEVHHGYAAGPYRSRHRVPTSLKQIGSSVSVFLKKYAPEDERDRAWNGIKTDQRRRLLGLMVEGRIEPRDVRQLMHGLDNGYAGENEQPPKHVASLPTTAPSFLQYETTAKPPIVFAGRLWNRRKLMALARGYALDGHSVSVFLLSVTSLFHKVRFVEPGIWIQTGGIFGRSDRSQALFKAQSFQHRVNSEVERVLTQRNLKQRLKY